MSRSLYGLCFGCGGLLSSCGEEQLKDALVDGWLVLRCGVVGWGVWCVGF